MASRSARGGTVLASGIRTRERKERKLYSDDWALGDEEIEGHHTFDLDEKVTCPKFDLNFVKDLTEKDFSLSFIQKNGFNWPILFRKPDKLGIILPSQNFSINDVRLCVGSRRMLDVMDVNTQKNVEMTMKDWQRYYESQDKDKLLNVISLEFSHTRLEHLVEAPTVVRQVDWVEKVWPRHLKESQTESTNVLEDMMYPKVQKYCLMSVSGCYTDFHIDFGGTSVWYHVLKGRKIFWLIPPSERNLQLYEQWVLSGKQSDIFFGDTVEKCARVELHAGYTFFIPTGWIHAVYTPDDSLVFGGNFLHSFGIEKQLRVATVEDTTHVPQKFRYPFFTEMLWYLLERYVHVLLGKSHLSLPPEEQEKFDKAQNAINNNEKKHIHLTQYELHGMKAIVMYLHSLPTSKKFVPELIKDPIALIRDVRKVVEEHRYDSPELAVTDVPVIQWWERDPVKFTVKRSVCDSAIYVKKRRASGDDLKASNVVRLPPNASKIRHRRIRCKECEPCTRGDCRQCTFCKDMIKYGGPGTMKQTCRLKKCVQPVLPATAVCYFCQMDGWMRSILTVPVKPPASGVQSSLMECILCFKISHPACLETQFKGVDSIVNEDLPNSWECAECIELGYNKEYKHNRAPSGRASSGGSDVNAKSPLALSESEDKVQIKEEPEEVNKSTDESKLAVGGESSAANVATAIVTTVHEKPDSSSLAMPVWEQLQARVSNPLVRPTWVIRPAPSPPPPDDEDKDDEETGSDDEGEKKPKKKVPPPPCMRKEVMLPVFSNLSKKDLLVVMRVCRTWAQWSIHPSLWKEICLSHKLVTEAHLEGVVRRQPSSLYVNWSRISCDQFLWLMCRLPQLQSLHCEGLSWGVIRSLVSPYCPVLSKLNLSFCEGVDDATLSVLLRAPPFNRPGFRDTTSRLRQLSKLRLSGTSIGDASVALIARSLPFLTHLDLSSCLRLTNLAPELLSHSTSLVCHSLTRLDLRGCHGLTPWALPFLAQLPILSHLSLDPCELIPFKAIKVWGTNHGYLFDEEGLMTRVPIVKDPSAPDGDSECEPETEARSTAKESLSREENSSTNTTFATAITTTNNSKVRCEINPTHNSESRSNDLSAKTETSSQKLTSKKKKPKNQESENQNTKDKGNDNVGVALKSKNPVTKNIVPTSKLKSIKKGDAPKEKIEKDIKDTKLKETSDKDCEEMNDPSSSDACRRSERRNKGKKYKINLAKRSAKDKLVHIHKKGFLKKKDTECKTKKSNFSVTDMRKRHLKKSLEGNLKTKTDKDIITRSKKPLKKVTSRKVKPEQGEAKSVFKTAKDDDKAPKYSGHPEIKDELKVFISMKIGQQYSSKLRKKSRDEDGSSQTDKEESKPIPKKKDESQYSSSKKTKSSESPDVPIIQKSPLKPISSTSTLIKKRKERTGSSSSSSPSSPSSPHIQLSKKIKVELEPLIKLHRRKSDSHKIPSVNTGSNNGSKEDPNSSGSGGNSNEKSSSRDRPERCHRSPRRLSIHQ